MFPNVWLPWQHLAKQFRIIHFSQRYVIQVLCAKFHDNRMKTAKVTGSRIFPKKCCYHCNDDFAHTKNNRCLRFTITHLHAKFEDDPRRIAAGRALTRKSLRRRRDEAKSIVYSELCSGDTIILHCVSWTRSCQK